MASHPLSWSAGIARLPPLRREIRGGVAWLLSERILGPTLPRPALTSHHHCKARFSRLLQVSFGIFFCNQRLFPIGQSIILQGLHSPGISYGRLVCQCNYKDMCWTFGTCGTMPWAFALEILAVLPSGCGGLQNNFRFWGKPLFTWFTWSKDASQQRVMQFLPSVETEQTITRPQTAQLRKRLSWWKKKLHLETKDNTGCISWLNCKREVARVRWQSWRGKN